MKETPIKDQVMTWLKSKDIYAVKNWGGAVTEPGRPDIFACVKGMFVGIELKATDKLANVSEAQMIHMRHIERNGGIWFAANSLQMVQEVIECVMNSE